MRLEVNNFSMDYEDTGMGIPLVLIHGYPLTRDLWEPQIRSLESVARVVAPSLRGHGGSDPIPGPYTVDMLADDVHSLLDNIGLKIPVILGGLSMGGYVAFAYYRKYPEQVAGLILAATRAGADSAEGKASREKAIQLAYQQGTPAIASSMLPKLLAPATYKTKPGLVNQVRDMMEDVSVEGIIGDQQGMIERPDSTPTLSQIDKPTLILHGEDDQLVPVSEAKTMRNLIKDSKLQVLPTAGHLLNLEQPDLFNQAVHDFILINYSEVPRQ